MIYRGYDIETLAENSTYEETAYLMLYETLPTRKELEIFKETLASERHTSCRDYQAYEKEEKNSQSHGCSPIRNTNACRF